jgi:hypothetical protein
MSLDPDTEHKIMQCVDEALETLGKRGKQALTRNLERNIGLKKKEIPQKPELFHEGLNLILGKRGADVLETAIVQKLLTSSGIDPKSKMTLTEVIDIIKAAQEKSC